MKKDVYGGETRTDYWQDFGKGLVRIFWDKGAVSGQDLRCEMRAEKIKKLRANFIINNLTAVRACAWRLLMPRLKTATSHNY